MRSFALPSRPAGELEQTFPVGNAARLSAPGDVITAIGNQEITSLATLRAALAQINPGTTVPISVVNRTGDTKIVTAATSQLGG